MPFFPTMEQDDTLEIFQTLRNGGRNNGGITKVYRCPNGHAFGIGENHKFYILCNINALQSSFLRGLWASCFWCWRHGKVSNLQGGSWRSSLQPLCWHWPISWTSWRSWVAGWHKDRALLGTGSNWFSKTKTREKFGTATSCHDTIHSSCFNGYWWDLPVFSLLSYELEWFIRIYIC